MTDLVNQTEFASFCDVTQQSISLAIKRGSVVKEENGLIDLDNKKNYQYLRAAGERSKKRALKKKNDTKEALKDKKNKKLIEDIKKNDEEKNRLREQLGKEIKESLSETELLDRETARSRNAIQSAKALQIYNKLIDKEIIDVFIDEIVNVIRKQGLTVGARSAPTIAAEFGRNTPEDRRFITSVIDKEQERFLNGLKRASTKKLKNKKKK